MFGVYVGVHIPTTYATVYSGINQPLAILVKKKKKSFFWAALPYIKHGLYFPILCTSSYLFMLLLKDCYSECSHGKDCKICAMQATAQIPIKYNKKPSMLISMRKARRNQCGVHMLSILTFRCGNGTLDLRPIQWDVTDLWFIQNFWMKSFVRSWNCLGHSFHSFSLQFSLSGFPVVWYHLLSWAI